MKNQGNKKLTQATKPRKAIQNIMTRNARVYAK
jgi:hypothetical protein